MKKFISFILSVFIFSLSLCSCVNNFEHGENFSFEIKAADLIKSIRAASLDDFGEDAYTDEYYKITATLTGSKGTVNTQNQYFLCEGDEEDNIYSQETIKFNFNNLPVNQTWNISVYVQRESENCSSTELYALQNDIIIEKNKTVTANLQFIQDEINKEIYTEMYYVDSDFNSVDGSEFIYTSKTNTTSNFYLSYLAVDNSKKERESHLNEYDFTAVFETPEKNFEVSPVELETSNWSEEEKKIRKSIYLPLAFGKKGVYKLTVTLKHKENGSYAQKKYVFYCGSMNTGYVMYNGGSLLYPSYPDRYGNSYSYEDYTFDSKGNIYFFSTYSSTSLTRMAPGNNGFENLYLDDSDFELKKIAFDRKTDKLYCLSESDDIPKQYSLHSISEENQKIIEFISSGDITIPNSPRYGMSSDNYHIVINNNCLYLIMREEVEDKETMESNYDIKLYKYSISEESESLTLKLISGISFVETLGNDFNSEYVKPNDIYVENNTIYTLFSASNFEINYDSIGEGSQHKFFSYGGIAIFNNTDSGMKYLKTVGCNNKKQIYKENSVPLYTNLQSRDGSSEEIIESVYINTAAGSAPEYSKAFFPDEIQISDYTGTSYSQSKLDYITRPDKFIAIKPDRICISEYGYSFTKAEGEYKYLAEPRVSIIGFDPETYSITLDEILDTEYPEVFSPKYGLNYCDTMHPSIYGDNYYVYDENEKTFVNASAVYCPLVIATEENLNSTY